MKDSASILEMFPSIAVEAEGWDPANISPGSGKKLFWKCPLGHKYEAIVYNRTKKNQGCPYCSGRKLLSGFNDLATKFPEIASQALGWDPLLISPGSNKKLTWICSLKHTWEERVGNRTIKGYGCPFCSNQRVWTGFNDLATKFPEIAAQAHGWNPSEVAPFSGTVFEWKCLNGHVWKSNVSNRTKRGDGCAICSSHKVLEGFNDLFTTNPELAKEAFGWDTKSVTSGSSKMRKWKCKNGHVFESHIVNRNKGVGCPVCAGKIAAPGFNDLASKDNDLAVQAFGWDPSKFTRSSNKRVDWKCPLGHIWKASINARSSGSGCPICAGKKVQAGFNDLQSKNPDLAKEAHGFDPREVTSNSHQRKQWVCPLGHIFSSSIANRNRGQGCPYCARQKVLKGFNDLATEYPELLPSVDGWDPTTVIAGSNRNFSWICGIGHRYKSTIPGRIKAKGCPFCLNKRVLPGFNDLLTKFPEIAREANGWNPSNVLPGSEVRKSWKCKEGHSWITPVYHRTSKKATGCPTCAKTGFDPNQDGYIYFLRHEQWEMLQIGITNVPDDRLGRHKRLGWIVLELRGPMDGLATQDLETSLLRMLKIKGAKLSHREVAGKFDGYSEAWMEQSYPVKSLKELIENLREFELTHQGATKNKLSRSKFKRKS